MLRLTLFQKNLRVYKNEVRSQANVSTPYNKKRPGFYRRQKVKSINTKKGVSPVKANLVKQSLAFVR